MTNVTDSTPSPSFTASPGTRASTRIANFPETIGRPSSSSPALVILTRPATALLPSSGFGAPPKGISRRAAGSSTSGAGVLVGGSGVLGGTGVLVGGSGVFEGGTGVFKGSFGMEVTALGKGLLVGATDSVVFVGGSVAAKGMLVTASTAVVADTSVTGAVGCAAWASAVSVCATAIASSVAATWVATRSTLASTGGCCWRSGRRQIGNQRRVGTTPGDQHCQRERRGHSSEQHSLHNAPSQQIIPVHAHATVQGLCVLETIWG